MYNERAWELSRRPIDYTALPHFRGCSQRASFMLFTHNALNQAGNSHRAESFSEVEVIEYSER
jgi:hypothetical protein